MPQSFMLWLLVVQLSITIGIMIAYLLGLFVPWRLLAVLGNYFLQTCNQDDHTCVVMDDILQMAHMLSYKMVGA